MKRTSRSRHHNANSPGAVVTIKRRRQYRKKNRTQHCNKRKNATTRKNYKGGIFKYIKAKYDSYKARKEEARRSAEGERLLTDVEPVQPPQQQQQQPRLIDRVGRFFRRDTTPPAAQTHQDQAKSLKERFAAASRFGLTEEEHLQQALLETNRRREQNKLTRPGSLTRIVRNIGDLARSASPAPVSPQISSSSSTQQLAQIAPPGLISIHGYSACSSPPPHTMFNTTPLYRIAEYGADNDPWTVYKDRTLMPIWTSQLGNMQKAFTDHGSNIDGFLQQAATTDDLLASNSYFSSYEAVIWAVVCDTQNLQNALMHSISTFKSEDAIVTCLVFQKFLFPFKTDGVSELITKKGFSGLLKNSTSSSDAMTSTMFNKHEKTIKDFAVMLLRSIMIQMSRKKYNSTSELNSKRELLLRLVSCVVLMGIPGIIHEKMIVMPPSSCPKLATLREAINRLFEVEDYKSTHYEEYKVFMSETVTCEFDAKNATLTKCLEIAAAYSKPKHNTAVVQPDTNFDADSSQLPQHNEGFGPTVPWPDPRIAPPPAQPPRIRIGQQNRSGAANANFEHMHDSRT